MLVTDGAGYVVAGFVFGVLVDCLGLAIADAQVKPGDDALVHAYAAAPEQATLGDRGADCRAVLGIHLVPQSGPAVLTEVLSVEVELHAVFDVPNHVRHQRYLLGRRGPPG
ncbi:hypothetical protein ABZ517_36560 [Streptomyces scabiei]